MRPEDFLNMDLQDISDYFLDLLEKSNEDCVKVDIMGCCKNERFTLRVCLCKGDGLK